jgi:pimeloyl-ACP methyl ester carboxylesterase
VSSFALLSTIFTALLAALAWGLTAKRGSTNILEGPATASGPACALSLTASMVWIHTIGTLLTLATQWLLEYLRRYPVIENLGGENRRACGGTSPAALPWCERIVLVPQGQRPVLGSLPAYVLALIASLLVGYVLVVVVSRRESLVSRFWGGAPRRAAHWHSIVENLPVLLRRWLLISVPISMALGILMYTKLFHRETEFGWWYATVTTASHIGALASIAFIAFGRRSPRVRQVFGSLADVLGFWPIREHPLAGSSYRDDVVAGLQERVSCLLTLGPVVLVGHSQGSVLCAWMAHQRDRDEELHLVTCGSPLASLYASVFPRYFPPQFFRQTRMNVRSWGNFWRPTDAIATPLAPVLRCSGQKSLIDDDEIAEVDPPHVRGHSDYWIEEVQMRYIGERDRPVERAPGCALHAESACRGACRGGQQPIPSSA